MVFSIAFMNPLVDSYFWKFPDSSYFGQPCWNLNRWFAVRKNQSPPIHHRFSRPIKSVHGVFYCFYEPFGGFLFPKVSRLFVFWKKCARNWTDAWYLQCQESTSTRWFEGLENRFKVFCFAFVRPLVDSQIKNILSSHNFTKIEPMRQLLRYDENLIRMEVSITFEDAYGVFFWLGCVGGFWKCPDSDVSKITIFWK